MLDITSHDDERCLLSSDIFSQGSDGILTCDDNIVRWINPQGNRVVKQFSCEHKPLDAVFMHSMSHGDADDAPSVAILVTQNVLRIFSFSGQIFESMLTFPACKLHMSSIGIIIVKNTSIDSQLISDEEDCILYALVSPLEPLRRVLLPPPEDPHPPTTFSIDIWKKNNGFLSTWHHYIAFGDAMNDTVYLFTVPDLSVTPPLPPDPCLSHPTQSPLHNISQDTSCGYDDIDHNHTTSSGQRDGGGVGMDTSGSLDSISYTGGGGRGYKLGQSSSFLSSSKRTRTRIRSSHQVHSLPSNYPTHDTIVPPHDLAAALGVDGVGQILSPMRTHFPAPTHRRPQLLSTLSSSGGGGGGGGGSSTSASFLSSPVERGGGGCPD